MRILDLDHLDAAHNQELNRIAVEIRSDFNALVDAAGEPARDAIDWTVGSIASRNRYHSPLFLRCCRLALVQRWMNDAGPGDEIRVADRALTAVLREHLRANGGTAAKVTCTEPAFARVRRVLRPAYNLATNAFLLTCRCFARSTQRRAKLCQFESIVLLDTFVLRSRIGEEGSIHNGTYKDRYYPGLLASLTEPERQTVFYLPTPVGYRNMFAVFRLIREAHGQFVIPDDYLRWSDYWYLLAYPLRILRVRLPDAKFRGIEVRQLLRQENLEKCCNYLSVLGLLHYRFARRLAEAGVRVRLLIDWNENQVTDRGLVAGFRRFHPTTPTIGYQGYIIAKPLNIYIHPTRSELRAGGIPHRMGVVGRALVDEMKEFCPELDVFAAPAFRFQKVWNPRKFCPDRSAFTLLVALPIALLESTEILETLIAVRPALRIDALRFWIKPHPTYGPDRIRELLPGRWPDEFTFRTGDFNESVEQADVLVGNGSSTCVEALAKGVPVVVLGNRNGISQNPIPERIGRGMWTMCDAPSQIAAAIQQFHDVLRKDANRFATEADVIRAECFEPVTRESVLNFLQLAPRKDATK